MYVYNGSDLELDTISSIKIFNEKVKVWNYELNKVHNYISDGILSHNIQKIAYQFTAAHNYIKDNSVNISHGDLVKLDSNNELTKVTSAKDSSVLGILWEKNEMNFISLGEKADKDYVTPDYIVSRSLQDSMGNFIPNEETGSKSIWRVAALGDSIEYDPSGSQFDLEGFKVCNQGGDIVSGDLLCSSDTPGYLMKQPSEWIVIGFDGDNNPQYEERQNHCSYTVAKSMVSSSWDSDGRMEGVYGYLYCG